MSSQPFQQSWCTYDWPVNDILANGDGHYERPHTLSEGDDRCDMIWAVAPRSQREHRLIKDITASLAR